MTESLRLRVPKTFKEKKLKYSWEFNQGLYTARYDDEFGNKDVVPFTENNGKLVNKAPKTPYDPFQKSLLEQANSSNNVFVVEGKKKAKALQSLGLLATTSLGGGNAASKTDWSILLKFDNIYLLPDNDEVGRKYGCVAYIN